MTEHAVAGRAQHVEMTLEYDFVAREGPGLIAAQHVHGAQVLDGGDLLDHDVLRAHGLCAASEAGRHDNRQHLRRDAHGDGDGEQQRVEPIALGEAAQDEHDGAHDEHEPDEHAGDRRHAGVETRGGRAGVERACDAAQVGARTGGHDDARARTALHGGAREGEVRAIVDDERPSDGLPDGGGGLLDGVGFAGEGGLGEEQVLGRDDAQVGGDDVTRGEFDEVAGDHVRQRDFRGPGVLANAAAGDGDEALQGVSRGGSAGVLPKRDASGDEDHDADDDGGGGVGLSGCGEVDVGVQRDCGECEQDEGERREERTGEAGGERVVMLGGDDVGAVHRADAMGLLLGEAVLAGAEQVHDLSGIQASDVRDLGVESQGPLCHSSRAHVVANMRAHAADDAVDTAAHAASGHVKACSDSGGLDTVYVLHPGHEAPP